MAGEVRVRRDARGTWCCRLYLGRGADGRPIQPYRSFPEAATEAEAQELAETWARRVTADGSVRSARLADLLREYVAMRGRNGASPNSVRTWGLFCDYVARHMPGADARDVTVADVNRLEARLLAHGGRDGAPLSRNTVLDVHQFLRAAYNHLVDAGVCDSNPVVLAAKPSPERGEAPALAEADFAELDRALAGAMDPEGCDRASLRRSACAAAAWIALRTGVRCGEACALRRRDLSWRTRSVHVAGTVIEQRGRGPWRRPVTKGRRCRNVSVTAGDVARLRSFLAAQARAMAEAGMPEPGPGAPVVTWTGGFERPTTVSREFSRLRDELGLPREVTFHGLRHTHATWCLAAGVDLKTLSERMGHADEATTLRVYAHVLPGRDAQAAEAFARAAAEAAGEVAP